MSVPNAFLSVQKLKTKKYVFFEVSNLHEVRSSMNGSPAPALPLRYCFFWQVVEVVEVVGTSRDGGRGSDRDEGSKRGKQKTKGGREAGTGAGREGGGVEARESRKQRAKGGQDGARLSGWARVRGGAWDETRLWDSGKGPR